MKKLLIILAVILPVIFTSCDVHEWPEPTTGARLNLHLVYDNTFTIWEQPYNERSATEYENILTEGLIQYIVRLYPINGEMTSTDFTKEFIFSQDLKDGYDYYTSIDVEPGEYEIMVWSQIIPDTKASYPYDYTYFTQIRLENHLTNTDYRDAFRGKANVEIVPSIALQEPMNIEIEMERPLAKFEFITTDLNEFILEELNRKLEYRALSYNDILRSLSDYNVIFHYYGYMPNAYSLFTDKPVDSATNISFKSNLSQLTNKEASLGFDYVFTNGKESEVFIQIEILDDEENRLSLTKPIKVPIKRSYHTIVRGEFLTANASGGIFINPEFDGDHNVILRKKKNGEIEYITE